jgi:hypothetical protein
MDADDFDNWTREVRRILPRQRRLKPEEPQWLPTSHQRGDSALKAAMAILGGTWRLE